MGLSHVPDDKLRAWVERTCAEQGVPVAITDPVTVGRVAVLLGVAADGPRAHTPSGGSTRPDAASLEAPPLRLDPLNVETAGSGRAGEDGGVVQDGTHDRVLSAEVEPRPLSA